MEKNPRGMPLLGPFPNTAIFFFNNVKNVLEACFINTLYYL
jgi:hypothetical protein